MRKLVFEQDPFAFGDKVLETWYPTLEEGNNKGNLLLVKNTKEGAIVGGPAFLRVSATTSSTPSSARTSHQPRGREVR